MSLFLPRALPKVAPALRHRPIPRIPLRSTRCFSTTPRARVPDEAAHDTAGLITSMSDAFLHLPEQLHLSSYTTSIVLATICLRVALTVPMQIWQRRRTARLKNYVTPEAREFGRICAVQLRDEYRRAGRSYEDYVKEFQRRASRLNANSGSQLMLHVQTKKNQKMLYRKYNCRPIPTILGPILVNSPVLISVTVMLRETCLRAVTVLQSNTPPLWATSLDPAVIPTSTLAEKHLPILIEFAKEGCLWSPSLADTDPSMLLPLLAGLAFLSNTELSAGVRNAYAEIQQSKPEQTPKGTSTQPPPQPIRRKQPGQVIRHASTMPQQALTKRGLLDAGRDSITMGLRGLSLVMVVIGSYQPTVGPSSLSFVHPS